MNSPNNAPRIRIWRPAAILAVGFILFCLMGFKDSVWTYAFWRHPWPEYTNIMARSFYEGELPGVSDIAVTGSILAFFVWLKFRRNPQKQEISTLLRFVFTCGITGALITVQSFKWIVSRARPKIFERDVLATLNVDPSSIWLPGFMGWDGPRGSSWNSFPSGHSGTCAILIALVYMVPDSRPMTRILVGCAVVALTISMAIGRSMAGMHWLSDSIASFFMVWAVVDVVAQYILPQKQI
jgi:membrane-associated phospholipid phosphatase